MRNEKDLYKDIMDEITPIIDEALIEKKKIQDLGVDLHFYVFCDMDLFSKILMHKDSTQKSQNIVFNVLFHTTVVYGITFVAHKYFKAGIHYNLFQAIRFKTIFVN